MTNKIRTLIGLAAAAGLLVAATANASTVTGRVTSFSTTSITVMDKELVTVGLDNNTVFTKIITQKPWQEDTALTVKALRVGAFVVVHVPKHSGFVANWVQIALDRRWTKSEPTAAATTPTAVYTYTDDALKHLAEAKARRANPTASESKRPGAVDTAAHCERLAAMGLYGGGGAVGSGPCSSGKQRSCEAPGRSGGAPREPDRVGVEATWRRGHRCALRAPGC